MSNIEYNPNYRSLLQLIFENCNKDRSCTYKIYQNDKNIDKICMSLSSISKFIDRIIKIVKSNLTDEEKIIQIQRFKEPVLNNDGETISKPIFDNTHSKKLLDLMTLFINPTAIQNNKKHSYSIERKPIYRNCYRMMTNKPVVEPFTKPSLTPEERGDYIDTFYNSLSDDELNILSDIAEERIQAGGYKSFVRAQRLLSSTNKYNKNKAQFGGGSEIKAKEVKDDDLIEKEKIMQENQDFFKELFHRISTKIQDDETYGTINNVVDYKRRLEMFVRETVQEMEVPENLKYFVDNITNLVDAIYPSNLLDFKKESESLGAKINKEFEEPFDLIELVLFALSAIPIPIINLIPDFMLIVHNILTGKRILFTILSSVTLLIKLVTVLFFDFGPLLKMFYLSKKIKNFNMNDFGQAVDKTVNDVLSMPGKITQLGSTVMAKSMIPLASAGMLRPENMSIQIGNNPAIRGPKMGPGGAIDMSNITQTASDGLKGAAELGTNALMGMLKKKLGDAGAVEAAKPGEAGDAGNPIGDLGALSLPGPGSPPAAKSDAKSDAPPAAKSDAKSDAPPAGKPAAPPAGKPATPPAGKPATPPAGKPAAKKGGIKKKKKK